MNHSRRGICCRAIQFSTCEASLASTFTGEGHWAHPPSKAEIIDKPIFMKATGGSNWWLAPTSVPAELTVVCNVEFEFESTGLVFFRVAILESIGCELIVM